MNVYQSPTYDSRQMYSALLFNFGLPDFRIAQKSWPRCPGAPVDLQLVQESGLARSLQAQHEELIALARRAQGC